MCAVSFVSDFYGKYPMPSYPTQPQPFQWPIAAPATLPWDQESLKLLQDVMAKMKELDTKLGLANCEDPKKAEWMRSIEERVAKLEQHG